MVIHNYTRTLATIKMYKMPNAMAHKLISHDSTITFANKYCVFSALGHFQLK
jgi:hypothetical protein